MTEFWMGFYKYVSNIWKRGKRHRVSMRIVEILEVEVWEIVEVHPALLNFVILYVASIYAYLKVLFGALVEKG